MSHLSSCTRVCSEPPAASLGPLSFPVQASLYTTGEWHIYTSMSLCYSLLRGSQWLPWNLEQHSVFLAYAGPAYQSLSPLWRLFTLSDPPATWAFLPKHTSPFPDFGPLQTGFSLCLGFPLTPLKGWLVLTFKFQLRCSIRRETFLVLPSQAKVLFPTSHTSAAPSCSWECRHCL